MPSDITFCIVPVPGPAGPPGEGGTNGTNGSNAYTVTTVAFTMPNEGLNETITVGSSAWASIGQIIFIEVGGAKGFFEVITKPSATQLQIKNLENTASGLYLDNSPFTTPFAIGATVSPAGLQGPVGSAAAAGAPVGATYITQTPDGTLTSEQAMSGLATGLVKNTTATGVQSIAVQGTDYYAPGGTDVALADGGTGASTATNARTNLGLVYGLDVQAFNLLLTNIAGLVTVADQFIYTTGVNTVALATVTSFARGLLDDVDAATMRATLGVTATLDLLLYRHQAASGVNGGTFTSGSWQTVPISTEVIDTGSHGSIAGNTFTLAAGTYRYRFGVLGFQVEKFQGRLFNVTDAGVITDSYGSVVGASGGGTEATMSAGVGRFTIAASKAIRLEAQCSTTGTTTGFGIAASFGGGEIYSFIELEKE